jgi:methionine-rich copper-binding protein CopC
MNARALGAWALLWWPMVTFAHAHLLQSMPADGSTLSAAPAQFTLKFSEAAQLTALSLQKQGESQAHKIKPLPGEASAQFSVPAPPLAPGGYELRYRVISADSHVAAGSVHFTVP